MTGEYKNLFGEICKPPLVELTRGGKPKRKTKVNGYAARPGTGPANETCKTCEHYCYRGGTAKDYRKCELMKAHWTRGPGSDIKARSPACKFWEKQKPTEQ